MKTALRMTATCVILLFVGTLTLSACGQKGPLYVPQEEPDTERPEKKKSN